MVIIDELEDKLREKSYNVIVPQLNRSNSHYTISLFDDISFSVELSISLLEQYEKDHNIDTFLKAYVLELLKQHQIECDNTIQTGSIHDYSDNVSWGNDFHQQFNEARSILLISGEKTSGKTSLVKHFCYQNSNAHYLWLDFNCSAFDFSKQIMSLINKRHDNRVGTIVIDNLECCGYALAKRIMHFFICLIELLNRNQRKFKLFIIQDNNYRLDWFLYNKPIQTIDVSKVKVLRDLKGLSSESENEEINDSTILDALLGDNTVHTFFQKLWTNLDNKQKKTLYKILNLCFFEIKPILFDKDKDIVKEIINKKSSGLKLFSDNHIEFYDKELCLSFISYIKDEYQSDIKDEPSAYNCLLSYIEAINKNNDSARLTYSDLQHILKDNYELFPDIPIDAFIYLINTSKNLISNIKQTIFDSLSSPSPVLFENHLGSIVFAAEALSLYSKEDWDSEHAWHILKQYIDETYFLGGQKLPEVRLSRENAEGTYVDFSTEDFNSNSIEHQMELQDELQRKYPVQFSHIEEIEDPFLCYFLSDSQKIEQKIDIDRFFRTYILSLIFEFQVTAPDNLYDRDKIDLLFNMILLNVQKENDSMYFYPARVPWVSARMLLALRSYEFRIRNSEQEEAYNNIIRGLRQWLANNNIRFRYGSEYYRIWLAGTGKWNSVLETTMLCTFALGKNREYTDIIDEGIRFINSQKEKWFTKKNYADGIWAYQNINMASLRQKDMTRISDIKDYLTPLFSEENSLLEKKNDRSLGETHIAKTLLSLVNDFSRSVISSIKKHLALKIEEGISQNDKDIINKNANTRRYKIGVTFTGTHNDLVGKVCRQLIKRHDYCESAIYYYPWHPERTGGISTDKILQKIYHDECDIIVVFLSEDYKDSHWTNDVEWESIKTMINTDREGNIQLLKIDSVDINTIDGLNSKKDSCTDMQGKNIEQFAICISDFYNEHKP